MLNTAVEAGYMSLHLPGSLMPGVRIKDNGPKAGLNGVDNGQIWFDDVRVPRDDMLDAFASVAPDGTVFLACAACCISATRKEL